MTLPGNEEWRPIPGFSHYEASSAGRIRRVWHKVLRPDCGKRRRDYPRVTLFESGKGYRLMVHILVAKAFIGDCPPGYEHNHKDGDKRNAHADNLEFVTHSQNEHHKFDALGYKVNQGSAHGMAKLTETDVVSIRALRAQGMKLKELGERFNVSIRSVSQISNHKTWRHILPTHRQPPIR